MELDIIVQKVVAERKITKEQFLAMVEKKKVELEGLVSEVGAAHIVANELGVHTLPKPKEPKISELKKGLVGSITLEVQNIYPAKEFTTKEGRKGRIATAIVSDEDGNTTRLALWGRHSSLGQDAGLGAKIRVVNAYVKEGMKGLELHVNKNTRISILEKGDVSDSQIDDQAPIAGDLIVFKASVRKILSERSFFSCPTCKFKGETCPEHGKTKEVPIVNAILDDGVKSIRAVFFGDKAVDAAPGVEKYFVGKLKLNDFSGKNELSVFRAEDVDTKGEIERLLAELT